MPQNTHLPSSLSREEVRNVDRVAIEQIGLPGIALMENAGRSAAEVLLDQGALGPVLILSGGGNNGGDGFVIARHLWLAGIDVRVLLCVPKEKLSGDAAINYHVAQKLKIPLRTLDLPDEFERVEAAIHNSGWIVDALLGTGLSSEVRTPFDRLIELVNSSKRKVLAVDLPSGLDCDTGKALGCAIRATITVTFVALKKGFAELSARDYLGNVIVAGIGVPAELSQQSSPA